MEHGFELMKNSPMWGLEQKLAAVLKPVTPDPVFVGALKLKLSQTPSVLLETSRRHMGLFTIGVGLLAGTLIIWIFRRNMK